MKIKTAILIGSGNVATHLGKALVKAGIKVLQVYSPTEANAKALGKKLKAASTSTIADINKEADLVVISIKDDALAGFCKKIKFNNALVVHTSGTADINLLKPCSSNYGVLYPFQTFTKGVKVKFSHVPLCVEGNTADTTQQLVKLAEKLSNNVFTISSKQRPWLHIMGVFSANFTNLMLRSAYEIAVKLPPDKAQTGPAVRGDAAVVAKHLEILNNLPELQSLYKINTLAINPTLSNNTMLTKRGKKTQK
jgi:predicted short-subunit dehydrogenase-like oxidoreductase (DUF2520 family)